MEFISSRNNPRIKEIRLLKNAKVRRQSGFCIVEGIWHFIEAVEAWKQGAYASLIRVFYSPNLLKSEIALETIQQVAHRGVPCFKVEESVFRSIAEKENPQGVLAIVRLRQPTLEDLNVKEHSWLVGLVEPQDPGNVGTILRTMDAVGAQGLFLIDGGVDPFHPEITRASMGAIFWIPTIQVSFQEMINWAAFNEVTIYGTSAHAIKLYNEIPQFNKPCILLLGNERQGLTEPQRQACHELLRLPMSGRVSSLNIAIAAGVMLYYMQQKLS
ncbi:MAG: RNA methyltransferase, TrmH family [Anaerolineae bacterium]|jgi:TrmH family RNA methyltransferase|nr:MAG: RNA methyltransferase, TrmH family [Anaerolineae bacterium]